MKKYLIFGLCMAFSSLAFCHQIGTEENKHVHVNKHGNKYYPNPENIHIDHHGIYLNIEGVVHQVKSISTDEFGTYIEKDELTLVDSWRCPNRHANPPWANKCLTCRWPD